jgi:hypothetical protein
LPEEPFHPRFLLSAPFTLAVAIGATYIPSGESTLGLVPIVAIGFWGGYLLSSILLSTPLFSTPEHKMLGRSVGPPLVALVLFYLGLLTMHVELSRRSSSPLVGLLLPIGAAWTEFACVFLLKRAFLRAYYIR